MHTSCSFTSHHATLFSAYTSLHTSLVALWFLNPLFVQAEQDRAPPLVVLFLAAYWALAQ